MRVFTHVVQFDDPVAYQMIITCIRQHKDKCIICVNNAVLINEN